MSKLLIIPLLFLNGLSLFGQIEIETNYLDANNWILMNKISVRQFVNELIRPTDQPDNPSKHKYVLQTVGQQDANWITKEDVKFLIKLMDSKEDAKCIMQIKSSYMPTVEKPTLGDQVILLINAYRQKLNFPYELTLCGDFGGKERSEIKRWWKKDKSK
ncbi:hypothetical protein [Altibacter sp.]|uniref:hypothetical protein n=1 Tax=Altibacter sp. TaxID=2024823 RepID=UPI0025866CD6|nr:hypothetical protein [Altibacter sp.]MCW9037879.1 hypothetical protein [Altibacter sp.]